MSKICYYTNEDKTFRLNHNIILDEEEYIMKKILIPLADGLEEIEAVVPIDVLRRAELEVVTCYLGDTEKINGSHEIILEADENIDNITAEKLSAIVLPGGMPGSKNLKEDKRVLELVSNLYKRGSLVAANCAAPMVLEAAGILEGKKATSYPGFDKEMPSCNYQEQRVVQDGNIITARGPGVALEFSYTIVRYLLSEEKASQLKEQMMARN